MFAHGTLFAGEYQITPFPIANGYGYAIYKGDDNLIYSCLFPYSGEHKALKAAQRWLTENAH